ncbi:MAG: ankyrin repeat domain-containing protein [Desulfomonilaceae bacterium]
MWVKIKGLFHGFRKLKTESDILRLQKRSRVVRGLFSVYRWWRNRKSRRKNPDNFVNACRSGDLERIKNLIQRGIDVNLRSRRGGRTGLMLAVKKNHPEVVEFLLASGADVNLVGKGGSGKSALIRSAEIGNAKITRMLVEHGAHLDVRSKISGKTALMKAAEAGFIDIVGYLLEKRADVHFIDRDGRTALSLAINPVNKNAYEIVEMLIKSGANVNAVDKAGSRALDRARELRFKDCEKLLLRHGAVSAFQDELVNHGMLSEQSKKAYEVIGSLPTDTDEEIRKKFHELAKKYHPDSLSGKDLPQDFVKFANERFVELNEMYKIVMESRKNGYK